MSLFSSVKSAYQSATKAFQNLGANLGRTIASVPPQPAAAGMAFPVTTPAGTAAVQAAGYKPAVSQPSNIYTGPQITGLQGGNIVAAESAASAVPGNRAATTPMTPTSLRAGASPASIPTAPSFVSSPTNFSPMSFATGAGSSGVSIGAGNAGGSATGSPTSTGIAVPSYGSMNANGQPNLYDPNTGKLIPNPSVVSPDQTGMSSLESLLKEYTPQKESVLQSPEYVKAQAEYDAARQRAATLSSQITEIKNRADAAALSTTGRGEGIPLAIIGGQQAEIYKEAAIQSLPIQSQLAYAQGDVQSAQEHLTRLGSILTEEASNKFEYQKTLFSAVIGYATDVQKMQLNSLIKQKETFATEQAKAYQMLAQNNAPPTVWEAARKATSIDQLYGAIGQYGVEQKEQILGSADTGYFSYNPVTRETVQIGGGKPKPTFALTSEQSADPFIQKLAASAGGKPLTDTPIQQLTKGISVLGQLGVLQTNVKDTNTGPIAGLFRGANPWDTNAQTIKAQLNAIVPNLARGIYGEVGVLTDNDIKTYAKTLPNLTSTEAVRNAVLGITVDLIGKAIKKTLEVNAAAGRDVSGFVDLYTEMNGTRDSIFAQIPGYKGAGTQSLQSIGVTTEEESLFDSVAGTSSTQGGGFFRNIWKGLTGQ